MNRLLTIILLAIFMVSCAGTSVIPTKECDNATTVKKETKTKTKSCTKEKCKKKTLSGTGWTFVVPDGWDARKENDKILQLTAETNKDTDKDIYVVASFLVLDYDGDLIKFTGAALNDIGDRKGFKLVAVEPTKYKGNRAAIVLFEFQEAGIVGTQLTFVKDGRGYALRCVGNKNKKTFEKFIEFFESFKFSKTNKADTKKPSVKKSN